VLVPEQLDAIYWLGFAWRLVLPPEEGCPWLKVGSVRLHMTTGSFSRPVFYKIRTHEKDTVVYPQLKL
jgi:hypothetical protein